MNCRPGDLAIVVRSVCGNEGTVVRCVRLIGKERFIGPEPAFVSMSWLIDPPLKAALGGYTDHAPDHNLRPIRDPGDDAKDESFRWAPAPEKATV
jgi:hypothetical protein